MDNPFTKASPRQGVEIGIVPLPKTDTINFRVKRSQNGLGECLFCNSGTMNNLNYWRLPPGSYTFLCASLSATEEQARGIVDWYADEDYSDYDSYGEIIKFNVYTDYVDGDQFKTALESLQSLLKSLGLDPSLNYALLKIETVTA